MANKITAENKHETVDYGKRPLNNFWKLKQNSDFTQSEHREKISSLLNSIQSGFVCICSEELSDKKLIKTIFDKAKANIKIYILVNEYSKELEPITGLTLIRFSGLKNIGSFILANPNSNDQQGLFFGGRLTEGSLLLNHLSGKLNEEEIKELFRHFCYHFWTNAKMEILEKDRQQKIEQKPMDIFYDRDKFSGKDYVYGTLFDFVEKDIRENLSGKRIAYLSQERQVPTEIKAETEQDLGDNKMKEFLPRDVFESKKPEFTDDGVSVRINFSWRNVPFSLPENAKEHEIYQRWKEENKKIENKLLSLLNKIQELENKENTLSSKIKLFFLGKKTAFSGLRKQINILKATDFPNISKEERENKVKEINDISTKIDSHGIEIDKENRKAKIDEDIEVLKGLKDKKEADLEEKNKNISEKKEKREKEVSEFCRKYGIESENKIPELLKSSEEELKSILKEQEALKKQKDAEKKEDEKPEDIEKREKELSENYTNIQDKIKKIKPFQDELKNTDIFIKKEQGEKDQIEREINNLSRDIENKNREKQKIDSQSPASATGSSLDVFNKKNKKQQKSDLMQKFEILSSLQQLPQTGKLYQLQTQTYLAIENWEDYENGKKEAERLKAKLCAEK